MNSLIFCERNLMAAPSVKKLAIAACIMKLAMPGSIYASAAVAKVAQTLAITANLAQDITDRPSYLLIVVLLCEAKRRTEFMAIIGHFPLFSTGNAPRHFRWGRHREAAKGQRLSRCANVARGCTATVQSPVSAGAVSWHLVLPRRQIGLGWIRRGV